MLRFGWLFMLLRLSLALQTLPPTRWTESSNDVQVNVGRIPKTIWIDQDFANTRDADGLTLIPPSAYEFAETFRQDLEKFTGSHWKLEKAETNHNGGIFLGKSSKDFTYEGGKPTEEGYELRIDHDSVSILGSGARGMWWGTRTLLQQLKLDSIRTGHAIDSPAFPTRGFMLDAGRKWYSAEFLKDLCTYASFFKVNEFHYHAADNYPLSRGHNETWQDVYSQFALAPEDKSLAGIVQRWNETLSRAEFEDFQSHCAARGVTVIPEIEAPGHALSITKWKPELAIEDSWDLLNLTHPDTIPTVKSIWKEFLPWFKTKEVHIGADEYDSSLADDYIRFVNEMSSFVKAKSGKKIRIWGTDEPSETFTIDKDIVVQHWQYGQSDPVELANDGYPYINSEDWVSYMSLKNDHTPITPAPYPQFFNNTRVLNFGDVDGWQWNPSLFNPVNITEQPKLRGNKGAIMAAWNDNGPDATTQLEAYYAIRNGIPVFGSRAWSGRRGPQLHTKTLDLSIERLTASAPGQNLDRRLQSKPPTYPDKTTNRPSNSKDVLFTWHRQPADKSSVHLGQGSVGMNHSLIVHTTGLFKLSSSDATLQLTRGGSLVYTSDGWPYPLRSVGKNAGFDVSLPGRIWTNETSSTHDPVAVSPKESHTIRVTTDVIGGSRVWVDGKFKGRFEVFVFGGHNELFSWSQMAFVLPLDDLKGGVQSLQVSSWEPVYPWS